MPYKNSDKRKEKSRDAARCRRGKESDIFTELAQCLPVAESVAGLLDKASIMRLTISELKKRSILEAVDGLHDRHTQEEEDDQEEGGDQSGSKRWDHLYQKALDGFAFILSNDGDIVYLSESVGKYLGLQQIELIGQSIYDFTHPCDHDEIRELLSPKQQQRGGVVDVSEAAATTDEDSSSNCEEGPSSASDGATTSSNVRGGGLDHDDKRVLLVRLKCTLTSKGRNVNLKSASYKPLKLTGRLLVKKNCPTAVDNTKGDHLLTAVSNSTSGVDTGSGSSPDTDLDVDDPNCDIGNGSPVISPLSGNGGFPFLVGVAEPIPHPSNIEVPLDSRTFLSKHSMDMRFIYCDDRIEELAGFNSEEMTGQSIYDFHHGLDSQAVEKAFKDLFSKGQTVTEAYRFLAKHGGYMWVVTQATVINNSRTLKPQSIVCVHHVVSGVEQGDTIVSHVQHPADVPQVQVEVVVSPAPLDHLPPKVERATESIFAPKTKDMSQAYFVPPEMKDTITFLNEEPADLSYLAPNAGDDFMPVVFQDGDALMSPALPLMKLEPDAGTDSSYRKSSSPGSFVSSNTSSRINSPKEYLNMTLPGETVSMDRFFQSMAMLGGNDESRPDGVVDDDDAGGNIDFSIRAPYIPMDGDEDSGLCPPTPGLLFTFSDDLNPGLFGHTEHIFGPKQSLFEEPPPPPKLSIQDMLGGSTAVASIERPVDTKYLQMKRPLDMNSLEKGPPCPPCKVPRQAGGGAAREVLSAGGRGRRSTLGQQPQLEQVVPQQMVGQAKQQQQQLQQKRRHIDGTIPPMCAPKLIQQQQQEQQQFIPKQQQEEQRQLHSAICAQLLQKRQEQQQQQQMGAASSSSELSRKQQQLQHELRIQQHLQLQKQQRKRILSGLSTLLLQKQQQQQTQQLPPLPSKHSPVGYKGTAVTEGRQSKDSVLLSLLLSGDESNHSYPKFGAVSHGCKRVRRAPQLPNLTSQECEVNAPTSASHLVEGAEILTALDLPKPPPYPTAGARGASQ